MTSKSILITGGSESSRLEAAQKVTSGLVIEAVGVDDIRQIEKNVSLGISIILPNAHLLTEEAQNAFLKTLEEPESTIVLLAENEDQLLDTVVSRCFLINLPPEKKIGKVNIEILRNVTDRGEAIKIIDELLQTKPYSLTRKLLQAKKYLQI